MLKVLYNFFIYTIKKTFNNVKHQEEIDRFLNDNIGVYNNNVIDYGIEFINRIETNEELSLYVKNNNIRVYPLLSELLLLSEYKYKSIGSEKLDENEINQVFGSVILNDEIIKLILLNKIKIDGLNSYGEFIYNLSDEAIQYFNIKYNIKLNKKFNMRDIIILNNNNLDNDINNNNHSLDSHNDDEEEIEE
jgi:hypothetical protein